MEREVGGGIRMGNTCKPMAVSFQCMTKSTTKKKKKKRCNGKHLLNRWSIKHPLDKYDKYSIYLLFTFALPSSHI